MLDILFSNPILFVILALILVVTLSVHEFAHAYVADRLGDSTPRYMGRLTLNPAAHLDPIGTLLMVLVGFGWGKPVGINSANFRNPRRDAALVALAGPASNILLATVLALIIHVLHLPDFAYLLVRYVILFNLTLAFFNLLPVYPLDGFNVVYGILPVNLAWQWGDLQKYGMYILLILIVTRTTGYFIFPLVNFSLKLLGL
jgi:Zn-dependent protease